MSDKRFISNIPEVNTVVSLVFWCGTNGNIVKANHPIFADCWLLVLLPVAVDAVEDSVLVFLGKDRVTGFRFVSSHIVDDHHLPPFSLKCLQSS